MFGFGCKHCFHIVSDYERWQGRECCHCGRYESRSRIVAKGQAHGPYTPEGTKGIKREWGKWYEPI